MIPDIIVTGPDNEAVVAQPPPPPAPAEQPQNVITGKRVNAKKEKKRERQNASAGWRTDRWPFDRVVSNTFLFSLPSMLLALILKLLTFSIVPRSKGNAG